MEQGKRHGLIFEIKLHKNVEKTLKKMKKHDPKLLSEITDKFESLKKNPDLGKKLKGDLEKIYFISIKKFDFRILYIKEKKDIIIILAIGHRRNIYDNMKQYLELLKV